MADIVFFEKPGCGNNTRQKQLLAGEGHRVEARSLLSEPWTREELLAYFGDLPVVDWFNKAAPRVKSGEVDPGALSAAAAIALMLDDHLLIRRPLMRVGERRMVGFEPDKVARWLGAAEAVGGEQDLESCRKKEHEPRCGAPGEAKGGGA